MGNCRSCGDWSGGDTKTAAKTSKTESLMDQLKLEQKMAGKVVSLCEDVEDSELSKGDMCWSTCQGQCPTNTLKPGLGFDFDEVKMGHPGCVSHYRCIGNYDRVLCHAMQM
eukprot:GEMP01084531.1.p1 GENE.GEMP01084531.1~~GEMP01084531.1.p1  ORF type:complete len:111 (+),score=19.83 GEMP01084531.1:164-496(+)